jgi:hypothetical protein
MEDERAAVIKGLEDVYQDWHWCTDAQGNVKHPNGRLNNAIVKAILLLKEDGALRERCKGKILMDDPWDEGGDEL